jgi:Cu+-exporting ATPase
VIKRNLIWACIYNVLGIPLAMGVFLPMGLYMHPMLAGAAMAFSSVSVVASSLTLKWWRRPGDSVLMYEDGGAVVVDGGGGWTGAFVDSLGGVREYVGSGVEWARWRKQGVKMGYEQVPVELDERIV